MLLAYLFPAFILSIVVGVPTYAIISSRRWMKKYGDGVYSPLRKAYKKAGQA